MNRQQFLKNLREYGINNTIPNISDVNAKFLVDLIKVSKTKNMLEIGTANGFSGINFGIELEKVGGKLLSIDFSEKSHLEALSNIKEVGLENTISLILGNALDEIPKLENNSYDFIFIDGMMRRSKDFLELSWPKLKDGGIIIIDDVIKFRKKMVGLWEYLEEKNINFNVLPIDEDDGVMMIVKNGRNINIFDKWNIVKKNLKEKELYFHEGEVWNVYNGQNVGFEQNGKGNLFLRPVLIVKKFNNDMFWGIPLTSQNKKGSYFYKIFFNNRDNFLIIPQMKLFSKNRFFQKMGKIDKKIFLELKKKVIDFLN